jgi:predicted esterase
VFLTHGVDDSVIPVSQMTNLASDLRARGATVDAVATPFVTHADAQGSLRPGQALTLVRWWTRVWAALAR